MFVDTVQYLRWLEELPYSGHLRRIPYVVTVHTTCVRVLVSTTVLPH